MFLYTWDNRKEDMLKEEKEFYQMIVNTCQNLATAVNNLQTQIETLKSEIEDLKLENTYLKVLKKGQS